MIERIERIKQKLEEAKKKDKNLKVFGADSHQYELNEPVSMKEVNDFEQQYDIKLPEEYVAFITMLGSGGPGSYGAAGPDYGIYELGEFGYMPQVAGFMNTPGLITTKLTEKKWLAVTKPIEEQQSSGERNEEADRKYDQLFSGLMPLGTRGCNFQTLLCLHGEDRGRVVYIDQDLQMPIFPKEKTFLDWYEGWIDRVLEEITREN